MRFQLAAVALALGALGQPIVQWGRRTLYIDGMSSAAIERATRPANGETHVFALVTQQRGYLMGQPGPFRAAYAAYGDVSRDIAICVRVPGSFGVARLVRNEIQYEGSRALFQARGGQARVWGISTWDRRVLVVSKESLTTENACPLLTELQRTYRDPELKLGVSREGWFMDELGPLAHAFWRRGGPLPSREESEKLQSLRCQGSGDTCTCQMW